MNVTIVDWDISYPATSGKRLRTLNLMVRLADRHRITYVGRGYAESKAAREAEAFLHDHGIDTLFVDHPLPRKGGPAFYARLAANLVQNEPYAVAIHASRPMRQALATLAAQRRTDVWQCEWTPYVDMVRDLPGARVLTAHNVDSLIWERYYETESHPLRRWYIRRQWGKFIRYEDRVFAAVDRVIAVSSEDAKLVRDRFGVKHVDVVENGVDNEYYAATAGPPDPKRVLFLGSLDWRPNLDGLDLLLSQVFPALLKAEPTARLAVVGRNPPPALIQRIATLPWAEMHADVSDVRPYLGTAGALVVPLRIGGGSRLKILEALAAGVPVVSTGVGAEGLALEADSHLTIVDETQAMAEAIADAIRKPELARIQARRGQAVVRERYDWSVLADKVERVWEKCVGSSDPRRSPPRREGELVASA